MRKIKISELPIYTTLKGLFTIGTDENNRSVKVPIEKLCSSNDERLDKEIAERKAEDKKRMKRPIQLPIVRRRVPLQPAQGCKYLKFGHVFHAQFYGRDFSTLYNGIYIGGIKVNLIGIQNINSNLQPQLSYSEINENKFPTNSGWEEIDIITGVFEVSECNNDALLISKNGNDNNPWYLSDSCVIEDIKMESIIKTTNKTASPYLFLNYLHNSRSNETKFSITCSKPITRAFWTCRYEKGRRFKKCNNFIFSRKIKHDGKSRKNNMGEIIYRSKFCRIGNTISVRGIAYDNLRVYALHRGVQSTNYIMANLIASSDEYRNIIIDASYISPKK